MRTFVLSLLLLLLVLVTVACAVATNGNVAVALAPAAVVGVAVAMWRLPLRWSLLVTTALAITLENPSDTPAAGQWRSPLYNLGAVMLVHINVTVPYKALVFSGLDVVFVYLFLIAAVRNLTGSRLDAAPEEDGPIGWFAGLTLAGAAWMWVYGLARGDMDVSNSLWQLQRIAYLPALVFLFRRALRGPSDIVALGKVIVWSACAKALLALYIRATVAPPPGESTLPYATSHQDSMLFAVAFCAVLVVLMYRRNGRGGWFPLVLVLPLLLAGMVANGRRLAWVELFMGVAIVVALTPWSSLKRTMLRSIIVASPLFAIYAAAGWGSDSAVFKPVRTLRSVVDSTADPSTMWRDLENYNLFYTLRSHPIFGTGYGHGYDEIIALPDISSSYALYRFLPHNSVLGLWAYGGLVGFTALWTVLVVGLYLAIRANRCATTNEHQSSALIALSVFAIYLAYCYGDLGLGTWISVFTVAPALAVSSKLAVATGAWPSRRRPAQAVAPGPRGGPTEWELCA